MLRSKSGQGAFAFAVLVAVGGCSPSAYEAAEAPAVVHSDAFDTPIAGASRGQTADFARGEALFELAYRGPDGIGPLFVAKSCSGRHGRANRGPGHVQKMPVVEADGLTAAADPSLLPFGHTIRPYLASKAITPLLPPKAANIKTTLRVGLSVLGRGFMEAVDDAEILRLEREQASRSDSIHGRINRITYSSETNPDTRFPTHKKGDTNLIGRFGLKARIATLDDLSADALQGDMGITSPLRPDEPLNPDGLTDDDKPGIDVPLSTVNDVAAYLRLLAIPHRDSDNDARGQALTIKDAILAHDGTGSEAANAVAAFRALSAADQASLVVYVTSV